MRPEPMLRFAALLAGLVVAVCAHASPAWKQLSSSQQALIQPALRSQSADFDSLPEARRTALVRGADRWLQMSSAERNRATQQLQQWQLLSSTDKLATLQRRERFRQLSPDERRSLLDTQKQFLELPLQQQRSLRDQFNELQLPLDTLPGQPSLGSPGSPDTSGTGLFAFPSANSFPNSGLPSTAPAPLTPLLPR